MSPLVQQTLVGLLLLAIPALFVAIRRLNKTLRSIHRDVVGFSPSIQAIATIQPLLIRATRYQNAALRELGANGSTEKSNACLDEADSELDRLLVKKIAGGTR